ncbi:MAG: anthranilate phosphoribosyltransferase [Phycisphaerales bacterium]|nr:anthranilate phosphoribosyltransferase [Phycisphaerales bacterium]
MTLSEVLSHLIARRDLTLTQARELFEALMNGALDEPGMAAILAALATKGEAVAEIVGAAEAMRARVTPVRVPAGVPAIDTCGTGGDGQPVFNVSSTVAIVAAAAGAVVAKHGNRSNARPSGSAEGLAALGVQVEAEVPVLERCLAEAGVAFLYALKLHPAMKAAAPVRRALGVRTIFNLVGPLTNPAGVRRQLLGVNRPELVETMIGALRNLGAERAMVVHGLDGLCDLSLSGPSLVGRWDGHQVRVETVDGSVIAAPPIATEELYVASADESAARIRAVLAGMPGPAREMVVFNTAAALWVAGLAEGWDDGAAQARAAIDAGAAQATLERWIRVSHGT